MSNIFQFLLCSYLISATYARTEQEIKQWFVVQGTECNKDYPITPDDMQTMMQKYQLPDTKNAKCLMACVYKRANWLDSKGMFDVDSANSMMEKEHMDDPARIEKSRKLFETCKEVNDEPVTDGNEGCDRAAHMFKCLVENALKMGFKIQ